jgi:glycosyltransferase involved in cell wall biosynthesis
MRPSAGDILISIGLDWDQSYTSHFYHLSRKRGVKVISCCYDLIPVLFPQYCVGDVASRFKDYFSILTWGSSAVLCISEQTKKDLLNLWSEIGSPERKTCVIPLGDNVPSGTGNMSKLTQSVITENFILFVSTIERRKNHEILYKAYHLLVRMGYAQQLPKLVFVGMPGWGVGDLLKDIELDPLVQGLIIQLNHVSDAELLELYQHALFCVYPSLYEGWGLPVGEALSLGKVVLSSDQGSLPEVGGNLVKYVPAWNPQAWADAIWELVSNPNILNSLATKVKDSYVTRKWSDTAKVVSELVTELLNESQSYEQTLYPGYDFSTQCGLHVGSRLESTGESGFLMFGPFISLNPGKYHLDIVGCVKSYADNAVITFDVVSNAGKHCYAITRSNITSSTHTLDEDLSLLSIDIDLDKLVTDMEIRCIVSNKLEICLNLIKIIKIY